MAASSNQTTSVERPPRSRFDLGAWQPLTGRGIAEFGAASWGRTLSFQFVVALGAALVIVWCVRHAWFPPINAALTRLPDKGAEIFNGRLHWPDTNAVALAGNPQFALAVDPAGTGELGRSADVQVALRAREIRLEGIFGHQLLPYPPKLAVPLDRTGGAAAWGAWNWVGLAFVGGVAFVTLFVLWWLSAIVLALPIWLAALLLRRDLSLGGAWRLTAAAWLPATLVLLGGVLLYVTNGLRLTGLVFTTGGHLVVMLGWLLWGFWLLPPRLSSSLQSPENPFPADSVARTSAKKASGKPNPFG